MHAFRTIRTSAALGFAVLALQACNGDHGTASTRSDAKDTVAMWNAVAVQTVTDFNANSPPPGLSPIDDSRIYAMAFTAMHDALNAIDRRYRPYLSDLSAADADPDAAVAQSVHDVMVDQVPAEQAFLDDQLDATLAAIPAGDAKNKGIALGHQTAAAILAERAADGWANAQGPYFPPSDDPGVYRATPPFDGPPFNGFAAYVYGGEIKPWVLQSSSQFRAPPDYAVTDPLYTTDYDEVKMLGCDACPARSDEQTQIANFWLENSTGGWDRIAATIAQARGLDGWQQARLYALLELAIADGYTTSLESKYFYRFWRPITAIQRGDDDGNPGTAGDPTWQSLHPAPPIPDYPSAHAMAGGVAQAVLSAFFGTDEISFDTTSASLPGITRSYTSLTQAARENADSRVYVGFHFRHATDVGIAQGQSVGSYVYGAALNEVP
jgi:hypothetical protein